MFDRQSSESKTSTSVEAQQLVSSPISSSPNKIRSVSRKETFVHNRGRKPVTGKSHGCSVF